MIRHDYETMEEVIANTSAQISVARNGDTDDVLNVCQSLLDLIERLNERDAPE